MEIPNENKYWRATILNYHKCADLIYYNISTGFAPARPGALTQLRWLEIHVLPSHALPVELLNFQLKASE